MRVSVFWVILFVLGTASVFLVFSRTRSSFTVPVPADEFDDRGNAGVTSTMIASNRKLKEINGHGRRMRMNKNRGPGNVNLEDYHPIDPVPSSKASIRPGPIQHGTPLNPYIPKQPAPPPQPQPQP